MVQYKQENFRMAEQSVDHKARLLKLREVFGRRQEIAKLSGKKHDVSVAKICEDAKVDKIYLYGHRLKEGDQIREEYIALKNEILDFQNKLESGVEKSVYQRRAEELESCYKALLFDVEPLQRELAQLKALSNADHSRSVADQARITELLVKIANLENSLSVTPKDSKVAQTFASRPRKHVVSPDNFRYENGRYQIGSGSAKNEAEAWGKAYLQLEDLLSRNLKMRLYVLVGLPCSGKSTWAEESNFVCDRHPVIWDATNLTSMDRYRLIISISRFADLPKTCIYFDTDIDIIRDRNRILRTADKQISEDDLALMRQQLERPNPYEEKWIDELKIVRDRHG